MLVYIGLRCNLSGVGNNSKDLRCYCHLDLIVNSNNLSSSSQEVIGIVDTEGKHIPVECVGKMDFDNRQLDPNRSNVCIHRR